MSGAVRLPVLAPGDRAPNLTLPDLKGRTRRLYNEVHGGPILVVTAPDPHAGPGKTLLDGLERRTAALRRAGAHCFVLTRRPPAAPDALAALIWIDPYGDAMALFRPQSPDGEPCAASAAVLDENQRLVAIFPAGDTPDPMGEASRLVGELAGGVPARELERPAPLLSLPRMLPGNLCERLVRVGGGRTVDDPDLRRDVAQRLGARLGNEVRRAFQFRPVLRFDPFQIVDAASPAMAARGATEEQPRRRFVVVAGLGVGTPGLVFPEFGPHVYRLEKGAAAAFSCELLYRLEAGAGGGVPVLLTVLAEPDPAR